MPEQTEQTRQAINIRQLVVLVRQKRPDGGSGPDLGAADSMVSKATGAVEGAAAAEQAMANIPGLNMMVKEEKKEKQSEDKYNYFEDYSSWDTLLKNIESDLPEMNEFNTVLKFEFSKTDAEGRKEEAQTLLAEVNGKMIDWKKYTSCIHFIGLGQGGNIANECTNLLAKDAAFQSSKWYVGSVVYVGTPLYKGLHEVNKEAFKGKGNSFSFGNAYDMTQANLSYFEPNEKLIGQIKDSNKGTLTFFTGAIKMHMVQIMTSVLKGVSIGTDSEGQSPKALYNSVSGEIEGLIKDIVDRIKQIISEGIGMFKPGDLPKLKELLNGFDQIHTKCLAELKNFTDNFTSGLGDKAKGIVGGGSSLGLSDLSNALNCLCPLFDTVSSALKIFSYKEATSKDLAQQILDAAEVKTVYTPNNKGIKLLSVDEKMINSAVQAAKNEDPDMAPVMLEKASSLLQKATKRTNDIKDMNDDEKRQVAEAIFMLSTPMLPAKIDFFKKLKNAIPFDIGSLMKEIQSNAFLSKITGPLAKIGIRTPDKLQASSATLDKELLRIKSFVAKNTFKVDESVDSLYFIYNSHNLMLKKCYGDIANCIDTQTGYLSFMQGKGFENTYNINENKYTQKAAKEKENVLPEVAKKEEAA